MLLAESVAAVWVGVAAAIPPGVWGLIQIATWWREAKTRRNRHFPDITGNWDATWFLDENRGAREEELFTDLLRFSSIRGLKVSGTGEDPNHGEYEFEGRISAALILTLYYRFLKDTSHLDGVIILQIEPGGERGKGYWYGLMTDGEIRGGRAAIVRRA